MKDTYILGIESSCDETAAAIVKNGREVVSNVINTQIDIHKVYGGVVPEIASRNHILNISEVVKTAISDAKIKMSNIDAVACTCGPGLVGALLVGLSYGKALSFALNIPLIGTNHIEGHIAANYITHKDLKPPFLCIMMSGGNTQIVHIKDYTKFEILGRTKDDAVGEAFDKVARIMELGYPGGPKIDELGKKGKATIELPKTHLDNLDFSFSGIKTAVMNIYHKNPEINKEDLCKSFEKTVADILIQNTKKAIELTGIKTIVIAGGVSANSYIRNEFLKLNNIKIYMPDLKLCTDNAAMIASAGYYDFLEGKISDLTLNAQPDLKMK